MPVEKDYIGGLHGYLKENFGDDFKLTTEQFKSKLSTDSAYANQLHGYLKENFGEGFKLDIADFQKKNKILHQTSQLLYKKLSLLYQVVFKSH
jgi:hypothetical protein